MQNPRTWAERIGGWYLLYLALLPAIGTFAVFCLLDVPVNPLLFLLLGTAAVGIYLAVIGSYTVVTASPWRNAAMLLDGPIWMAVGLLFGGSFATAIVNDVLIEITAVLVGIFSIVLTSRIPTPAERRNALIAVGLPLIGIVTMLVVHTNAQEFNTKQYIVIAGALIQGAFVYYRLGASQNVQRPAEKLILIGIVAWMLIFFFSIPLRMLIS